MSTRVLRVLLLADTHLGFDDPIRPRTRRPRRGPDFFAAIDEALAPARADEVDLVVHGGDLLYRSKVPASLTARALEPLLEVADRGIPVVLVPGNHERSALPYPLLAAHRLLEVLDRPRTVRFTVDDLEVAVSGFPCERDRVRCRFPELLGSTGWRRGAADVQLLAMHQTVEGARVGPSGYTFRSGADVVPGRLVPAGFAAVLCGHIHRHQVLEQDLDGRPLAAPVLYPGSTERTSFAERDETKGSLLVELEGTSDGGRLVRWRFLPLQSRPMLAMEIEPAGDDADTFRSRLAATLGTAPPRAVIRLSVETEIPTHLRALLTAEALHALAPPDTIVELRGPWRVRRAPSRKA